MSDYSDSASDATDTSAIDEGHFVSDKEEDRDIINDESVDGSFIKGGKKVQIDEDDMSDEGDEDENISFDEDDNSKNKNDYFSAANLSMAKPEDKKNITKASILQSLKNNAKKRELLNSQNTASAQKEEEIPDKKQSKTIIQSSSEQKEGGALKPTSKLQFLREQKKKLEQIKIEGEPKINYHQSYKDVINKKLGLKVTTIEIKLREELQQYVHLCLLTDYQISEVVASCKEYHQLTGQKASGDEEYIQMYDDDCNIYERILLKIPVILFDNFSAIQKQLNDYYLTQ